LSNEGVDDDFLQSLISEYIDSSLEGLTSAQELSYLLKSGDYHLETVKEIFRVMHSLKGSSAIVGCLPVRNLAHSAEWLLEKITSSQLQLENDIVDLITITIDQLILMIESYSDHNSIDPDVEARSEKIVADLEEKIATDPSQRAYDKLFTGGMLDELNEHISNESKENAHKSLGKIRFMLQSLLSQDENLSLTEVKSIFDELSKIEDDSEFTESLYNSVISELKAKASKADNLTIIEKYKEILKTVDDVYDWSGPSEYLATLICEKNKEVEELEQSLGDKTEKNNTATREKTMRVPELALDDFIQYIGDLIIVREMIDDSRNRIEKKFDNPLLNLELKRHLDTFSMTLSKLEDSAMTIRKQSVRMLMNKMSRLAREIAQKTEKSITMNNIGSEVKIDKSLLELIEAPLIHIINNAVDHGIEAADARLAAGKKSEGVILFQAEELEETIRLTISDDGNGMNFEALREKGKKMGVVGESATNEELLNIIFLAGFSTKEEVTDVSGRGVGMDVVKRELEKIGGSISVKSETGTGSTFTLILPKSITTQIIQGYLIEVAGEPFIIPVKCVMESFHPDKANLVTMYDSMECLERRGDIMPVIPVASYLYDEEKPREHTIFVIVEEAGRQYALLVDKVIGIQQVVLKELNGMKMKKKIFSGAALMGNGNVALVLDLSAFLSTSTILQKRNN
jgi:two-component system, chemotaxis family, sensor kinase CheA